MECLKLTYKPIFELRTHERMLSREAKVVQMFTSVDPLAEETMEPYSYTGNNPIMFTDPTGMSKFGIETHFVNEKGETIANTDDGSNEVFVIRKENEDNFVKALSEMVKTEDDLKPKVNQELGEEYGYNIKEHHRNVDGGQGENYQTDYTDDRQIQWAMGYDKGYNDESMILDMRSYQPGSSSLGLGYSRGETHRESGKMHAFEPKLSNKNASNYIKTNRAPGVNYRKYSEEPIPLLIDRM